MHRHNHNHSQNSLPRGRPVNTEEGARASDCFEQFLTAPTLKTILGSYRNICEYLHLKPNVLPLFYPKLKAHINSWKAKPLWKKFDTRANQKCYGRGKACPHTRVLIIGAGPCGLRTAIEAQLLGAKVVVVEKRDRMSRNNVLHLWPFVIDDLRALGAKKFFGKFCAGSIDHISIRQLQCILLKVALLLGVEIHTEVSFEKIIPPNPNEKNGWRAEFKPADHPVSQFEFDVIIGADGKRNTLQGFKRKEFRGKLAIAITANFINKRTEAEARVEEISGVAFIFNQKFFKDLYAETGIDLENIVYYKDDTHYFVMTAKKQSLIDKGVIREDLSDTAKLLAPDNVDREELMNYAREAAEFSTNYQMLDLEFAVNHYGQPDVAMFDFTSMYAAENASRVVQKHNYKLLSILVGDSLLEPFWPTGSGCARGFLSSMDAAWAIRSWGSETSNPLEVMAERESIYRLLAQTTPENLNKDYKSYTIDPSTRYPNLNRNALLPHQVTSLFDTDDPKSIELTPRPIPANIELPKKRRRRESDVDPDTLLSWIKDQVREHEDLQVVNLTTSFRDGRILCAIISHYRPDLLDYSAINPHDSARNNQIAFDLLEKELGIQPVMTAEEMVNTESIDFSTMQSYLTKIYDTFRCEIPHIKYPKWDLTITRTSAVVVPPPSYFLKPLLITPNSSAKISEDEASKHSSTNTTFNPKSTTKDENLILIPIKSIENYLSLNNIKANDHCEKMSVIIESVSDFSRTKSKVSSEIKCGISKSDPSFSSLCKSKLKVIAYGKKIRLSRGNGKKFVTKYKRKRKRIDKNSDSVCIFPYNHRDESTPESYVGSSGDHLNLQGEQDYNVTSKHLKSTEVIANTANLKLVSNGDVKYNKVIYEAPEKETLPNVCLEYKHSNETRSSMAGSTELTLNFLKEMDTFLNKKNLTSDRINTPKNNVEVKIKPRGYNYKNVPKEIPIALLNDNAAQKESYPDIFIKNIERRSSSTIAIQVVKFFSLTNCLSIIPKLISNVSSSLNLNILKSKNSDCLDKTKKRGICQRRIPPDESFAKVEGWIKSSNFASDIIPISEYNEVLKSDIPADDSQSILTSVTKQWDKKNYCKQSSTKKNSSDATANSRESVESLTKLVEKLKSNNAIKGVSKTNNKPSWELYEGRTRSKSEPGDQFSTIIEAEESDMPEVKRNEHVLKVKTIANYSKADILTSTQPARPSSRHKRHVDTSFLTKSNAGLSQDRKARKRKTLEKVGASVIITAFIIIIWETGFVAFILLILDFLWNSEQYGFQNFLFG